MYFSSLVWFCNGGAWFSLFLIFEVSWKYSLINIKYSLILNQQNKAAKVKEAGDESQKKKPVP